MPDSLNLSASLTALVQHIRVVEQHCPCGARPESPKTHPHMTGCLIALALEEATELAALLTRAAPPADSGWFFVHSVLARFEQDEAQGYHTKDRAFAIDMLRKALEAAPPAPSEGLREKLAAWEKLRPKGFLEHATVATSQYDEQYRSMAAEILALRTLAATGAAAETPAEGTK
jgi:hypothetical protein